MFQIDSKFFFGSGHVGQVPARYHRGVAKHVHAPLKAAASFANLHVHLGKTIVIPCLPFTDSSSPIVKSHSVVGCLNV